MTLILCKDWLSSDMFREIIKHLEETVQNKDNIFKGVVHIGAHLAEELDFYEKAGASRVMWVEANPVIYEKLVEKFAIRTNTGVQHSLINKCLSDQDGQVVNFNITNKTQSSSMLNLQEHLKYYPDIKVVSTMSMTTTTFQKVAETTSFNPKLYDFLCIDVQGAEMNVLRGFGDLLGTFSKICIEVNEEHLYENGALLADIDKHLNLYGFVNKLTVMTEAKWGEALYVK